MCDYSLHAIKTRDAKVGDKLITHQFAGGTTGMCDPSEPEVAVCLRPGTELAFDVPLYKRQTMLFRKRYDAGVAKFVQRVTDSPNLHRDALEMPNGEQVLITLLEPGQHFTVLQLPSIRVPTETVQEQERPEAVA